MKIRTPREYRFVVQSNARLNQPKNAPSGPLLFFAGRRSSALSAGLSDSALNAEIRTDAAIVSAN